MKTLRYNRDKVIKTSKEMFPPEKCERCGRCCIIHAYKTEDGLKLIYCEHFDPETKLCKVYEDRYKYNCLTILEAILAHVFPKDCPFVRNIENYEEPNFYKYLREKKE
ncbi:YcgN family cysteine cluster protein [Methanocaldococcus infernus]